jgi:serine protease Do
MKLNKTNVTLALLLLCAGLLTANLLDRPGIIARAASPAALTIPDPVQLSNAFSAIAKQAEPSVVQIVSTIQEKAMRMPFGFNPFGNDSPFEIIPPRPQKAMGLGSGFIVDPKGYILTNNHVVENATRIQVTLPKDTNKYTAKLIGTDPELDLAVLKINADRELPTLHMGNSDAIETGDWVVAIGSPFGLDQTMTAGIISAKGRELNDPGHQLQRFLQTDAAINRGNSGGPLLNIHGEVIGINTMIASGTGNFEGIGFALPSNLAVNSYNQIIKTGKVSRGAIGVQFAREQNDALLKAYGASSGVFVQQVTPGGPAAQAGIQASDIIVGANNQKITDGEQLVSLISAAHPGSTVHLKVLRDGKTLDVPVHIGDRAQLVNGNGSGELSPEGSGPGEASSPKLGVSLQDLTREQRADAGLTTGGVLVAGVEPGSFADDIGLAKGDVIVAIDRQPVTSAADVRNIMRSAKSGQAMAFRVMRNTGGNWNSIFLAGTLR